MKNGKMGNYSHLIEVKNKEELHKSLCSHFSYLADREGFEPILSLIMEEVHKVDREEDNLVLFFRGTTKLFAAPPADKVKYKKWPASFQKYVAVHESLSFPDEGYGIRLGWSDFEPEFLNCDESDLWDSVKAEDIQSPITNNSDWWIYHPGKMNHLNEPSLCLLHHEGGDLESPVSYSGGALFLKEMAETLELKIELPKDEIDTNKEVTSQTWWEELTPDWKKAFLRSERLEEDIKVTDKIINKILIANEFKSHDDDITLDNLKPLEKLTKLKVISISRQKTLTDLTPVSDLSRLERITISSGSISDLSPLKELKRMQILEFSDMEIQDITPLKKLKKLQRLELVNSKVVDLSTLKGHKKLESIDLSGTPIIDLEPLAAITELTTITLNNTSVSDLTPLSRFPRLGCIYINNTKITDLSPLKDVPGIFIFHCKNTAITFKELLTFASHRLEETSKSRLGLSITCDDLSSVGSFIKAVDSIDFPLEGLEDVLASWTNTYMTSALNYKTGNYSEETLRAFMKHGPLNISTKIHEELLGNMIVVLMKMDDSAYVEKVLTQMTPELIKTSRLAFNLACFYAKEKDRAQLLKYTIRALEMGHEPNRFREDSDFEDYRNDGEFEEILLAPHSANPAEDPAGWWNPLSEEWKDIICQSMEPPQKKEDIVRIFSIEEIWCSDVKTLEPLRYMKSLKKLKTEYGGFTSIDPIAGLKNLEEVIIEGSEIDKARIHSIEALSGLTGIKYLKISEQKVSDLSPLENLVNLEKLELNRLSIKSIESLRNTRKLISLSLNVSDIEDIDAIAQNEDLKSLSLNQTKIKDLSALSKMTKLGYLNISGSSVSDLTVLKDLKELSEIECHGCPITSLEPLEDLPDLTELCLGTTSVPKEEIKAFKKRHPQCEVVVY